VETVQCSTFYIPTKIISGKKTLESIPYELDRSGNAKKPLVIAHKKNKSLKQLINAFAESGVTITVVPLETDLNVLDTAITIAKSYQDHDCDSLIACGDRSIVNLSKIVNILVSENGEDLTGLSGVNNLSNPLRPLIFVPTLCDTGNGLTNTASIINENGKTLVFKSRYLFPKVAVLDPRMIESPSKEFLVNEGLKGLFYAVESFLADEENLFSNGYARTAIELIYHNLLKATKRNKASLFALANASCMVEASVTNSTISDVHRKLDNLFEGAFVLLYPYYLESLVKTKKKDLSEVLQLLMRPEDYIEVSEELQNEKVIGLLTELQHKLELAPEEILFKKLAIKISSEDFKDLMQNFVENTITGK